jgi:hypothetical protein
LIFCFLSATILGVQDPIVFNYNILFLGLWHISRLFTLKIKKYETKIVSINAPIRGIDACEQLL